VTTRITSVVPTQSVRAASRRAAMADTEALRPSTLVGTTRAGYAIIVLQGGRCTKIVTGQAASVQSSVG
jgi:hypothetical protein